MGPSQALQDKYQGWEGRETAEAFERYCRILFERLGKKVTYWVTMNEQNVFTSLGYRWAAHPPGLKDLKRMYAANHIINLANAKAINLFHELVPQARAMDRCIRSCDPEDVLAAENGEAFNNAWFLDVIARRIPEICVQAISQSWLGS